MKRRNLKNKVAILLSASMAFAMLAPAMPAYAANPKLIFDFKTKNEAIAGIVDNWNNYSGISNTLFKAQLPVGWKVGTDNIVGLPYWETTESGLGGATNGFNTGVNNPKDWNAAAGMDLEGYKIESWKNDKTNATVVNRVEQPYFQNVDTTYYATIISDSTAGPNNDGKIASYWVTRRGKAGIYVPGVVDDPATPFAAGASIPAKADVPTGYKLLNNTKSDNGDGGRTIDIFDSKTVLPSNATEAQKKTLPTGPAYGKINEVTLDYDSAKRTTIKKAHNRDVVVNYRYDVDSTQLFNVNVWDVFFDASGNEISRSKRTTLSNKVLDDLGATVGFDTAKTTGSPARYVQKGTGGATYIYQNQPTTYNTPVTVVFSKERGSGGEGDFAAANMVDALFDLPNSAGKTFNIDSDNKIAGKMINQKVDVYYNYQINPAYFTNISVQYVDENGTNITNKVIAATKASGYPASAPKVLDAYDLAHPEVVYVNGNELMVRMDSALGNTHVQLPIPKLSGYKFSTSDITIEPLDAVAWSANYLPAVPSITVDASGDFAKAEVWQPSSASASVVLRVTYNMDAAQLTKIIPQASMGGELKVANALGVLETYEPSVNAAHQKYATKTDGSSASTKKVTITADDLPEPVPNAGYLFEKWIYTDGNIEFIQSELPKEFEIPTASSSSMKFTAVFKEDPALYNAYHLESGDGYTQIIGDPNPKLLNVDALGNHIDIRFSDLSSYTNVGTGIILTTHPFGTDYNVVWYDSSNNVVFKYDSSGNVLEYAKEDPSNNSSPPRAIVSGEEFKVYIESNVAPTAYDPQLDNGSGGTPELLNSVTGEPQIVIDPSNPSPMSPSVDYVVTDEHGNVVQVIPGTRLVSSGGVISNSAAGSFLNPGNNYKVYTALKGSGAVVGSPIPASGVSTNPLSVTIPVAPTPLVTADIAHEGKAMIKINPTADNTEYALVDDDGNEVYPFTTPTAADNGTVTFNNLDPDTIYHVVPRAKGSATSVADRMAAGAQLPVDTANLGLAINKFKVEVTTAHPGTRLISAIKIDGDTIASADFDNALSSVEKGKTVEIVAPLIDGLGNNYYTWRVISPSGLITTQGADGNPSAPANTRIVFTMPNGPVKLQIMYDDGVIWDPNNWTGDNISNKNIGVAIPNVNVPSGSQMRITVKKDTVPANIRQTVADTMTDEYRAEYMFRIALEQKDPAGNWVEYTDPSGDISLDDVRINTGALDFSKNYMLHELATSSNAVSMVKDNIGRISSTSADPNYTGEFGQNMYTGKTYVFGYTKPVAYKVKIVDISTNILVASFSVPENHTVNDFSALYSGSIKSEYVGMDGLTWSYKGLSTDRDRYIDYDANTRVTQDITIYLFYTSDKNARKRAEDNLKGGIQHANNQLSRINDPTKRAALQAAIDAAQAVIDKINRKSSTPELVAALAALNQAIRAAGGTPYNPNAGGGGGGGSSGGGGSARRGTGTAGNPFKVGYDGNWELLNPEEAQSNLSSSKWVFNITNGGQVIGWAYLSYTYEGYTKSEWYHFGTNNIMDSGWFFDGANGKWYFLSKEHNGFFGEMKTGWIMDGGRWYYLNPANGEMVTGWIQIDGSFYYFNTAAGQAGKPYGAMYSNERTPDGYNVNSNGVWN